MRRPMAIVAEPEPESISTSLMLKVMIVFVGLAAIAAAIAFFGRMYGHDIAMAGHTDSRVVREIVIGNNVLAVPDNAIRFERARRDGVAGRLDLYLRWPDMQGYSQSSRDDFNHAGGSRNILFLSLQEQMMSRDMDGRFDPIYSALVEMPGRPAQGGLVAYAFKPGSGYMQEELFVGRRDGRIVFVVRCLTGTTAEESLAPCERDVQVGENLSLAYRFPSQLLPQWQKLDAAVRATAGTYLKTGRP